MRAQRVGNGSGDGRRGSYADFIAGNVRAACARRQVSQTELVRRTPLSRSTLNRKWHGLYPYDVAELEAIAVALEAPLTELLDGHYERTITTSTARKSADSLPHRTPAAA